MKKTKMKIVKFKAGPMLQSAKLRLFSIIGEQNRWRLGVAHHAPGGSMDLGATLA